jgi:hypothetical protein
MRAFFMPEAPWGYGFRGVIWWVAVGRDGGGGPGKLKSWKAEELRSLETMVKVVLIDWGATALFPSS